MSPKSKNLTKDKPNNKFRTILTRFLSILKSKTLPWAKNDEMAVTQVNEISYFDNLLNILLLKKEPENDQV